MVKYSLSATPYSAVIRMLDDLWNTSVYLVHGVYF